MLKVAIAPLLSMFVLSDAYAISIGDPFPTIGASATFKAAGQVLSSAPLPSLDGGRVVVTPQVGIITVEATNDMAAESDALNPGWKMRYFGEAKGNNAGLTVAFHASKDFSFFILGGGAKLSGEYSKETNDQEDQKLTEFSGQTIAGSLGVQYRLIGTDDSWFALGLFGGPMYYSSQATGKFQKISSGTALSSMRFNPSGLGALLGFQFMVRLGGFRINPYFKMMGDLTDMCKKVEFEGGPVQASEFACDGKTGYIGAPAFAGGYGLLVGYKSFLISVLSASDDSADLKTTSTSISFGISL